MSQQQARPQPLRVLDLLEALCGYAALGASNSDLCRATGSSPSQVTRDAQLLIDKGWARKCPITGRFYPTAEFTRLISRVDADFDRAERQNADRRLAMTGRRTSIQTNPI